MFRKILVALDSGDTCDFLFSRAIALAQSTGAELVLLSVLTPEDCVNDLTIPSAVLADYPIGVNEDAWTVYQEGYRAYEEASLQRLQAFCEQAEKVGVTTKLAQSFGRPGRVICHHARDWETDAVMVGSHGRQGLKELFLGSVSNYVMHHAPCSVIVVREQAASNSEAELDTAIEFRLNHSNQPSESTPQFSAIRGVMRDA